MARPKKNKRKALEKKEVKANDEILCQECLKHGNKVVMTKRAQDIRPNGDLFMIVACSKCQAWKEVDLDKKESEDEEKVRLQARLRELEGTEEQ